jgi:hypothetical protein
MLMFALYCLGSLVASFLQESLGADFSDLGRKLLGGFAVAVVVAIAFTIIKLRLRDKRPAAKFISVTSCAEEDVVRNSVDD